MTDTSEWTKHYRSTKTYTATEGLSCCFRQWRAESHCRFLHGYPIQVHFEFAAEELDVNNWVVDFGALKSLKQWLKDTFDHKTIVAEDDPNMELFEKMYVFGLIDMKVLPSTGVEKFAEYIYNYATQWLIDQGYTPRVRLVGVHVSEHDGNGAIFYKTPPRVRGGAYRVDVLDPIVRDVVDESVGQADRTRGFGHVEAAGE